jgi:hypothetical protein
MYSRSAGPEPGRPFAALGRRFGLRYALTRHRFLWVRRQRNLNPARPGREQR